MWNILEQSSVEDNTISNAYSARGIFKIRSDEAITRYPQVQAAVHNDKMVIAVDRSILLGNELGDKCSFLSFSADLDVVAVSQSGNLILCGLRDGEIHGIFVRGVQIFNVNINVEDVHMTGATFASVQQIEQNFYFICTNGSVYKLSEVKEPEGIETCAVDDTNLEQNIEIERLCAGRITNGVTTAVLLQILDERLLICCVHNTLHFINVADVSDAVTFVIPEEFAGIKKIYNLENYILLLTNSGHLLDVCPFTKIVYLPREAAEFLIDEIIVMECSNEKIELLLLSKSQEKERLMKLIEYPSLKCQNEMEVGLHTWLVQQQKDAVNLYYVNGNNLNLLQLPTEIEMTLVSETEPSDRFKKLIAKGHWTEAENFGKQFELCLQPLYEARAKRLLLQLSTTTGNNADDEELMFENLIEMLQKVENIQFFRSNRMFVMPSRQLLKRYLNEMLKHFDAESPKDEIHVLEIREQLNRLDTLNIIDPNECNMEWQNFIYSPNLLKVITTLFQNDMSNACLVWKRHASAFLSQVFEQDLHNMLNMIPNNVEPFQLIIWLGHFVPIIIHSHPSFMPLVTEWSIEKTRSLQHAKNDWPEIGLEFATKVLNIYEDIEFLQTDVSRQHERSILKLKDLVNALQDLSVLKKSFNLILTLDNYLQDSIDETAFCILQRVQLDKLKSLVNDFLYPIFQEKGKYPVAAISRYIKQLVISRNVMSMWLERAVVCIEMLHNEDDRMESALLVLQYTPVPWPESVNPLVKLRTSTHPLAVKISTEYEIQVIKIMKVKYGWPADSVLDFRNINLFVLRIVTKNLPDIVDDIRILTEAAPEVAISAHFNYCYQVAKRGRIEEAVDHIKWLRENHKQLKYVDEILNIFIGLLETARVPQNEEQVEQQQNLITFLKYITIKSTQETKTHLDMICKRLTLMQKFKLKLPHTCVFMSREERLELLETGIENIIQRSHASLMVCKFMFAECKTLCHALDLPIIKGITILCQRLNCIHLSCALTYCVLKTVDCDAGLQEEFVELALLLIVQEISLCQSSCKQKSEQDSLALLFAYELLLQASLQAEEHTAAILELLQYLSVVHQAYDLNIIEAKYAQINEPGFNENLCKLLEAEGTKLNGSFELKNGGDSLKHTKQNLEFAVGPDIPLTVKKTSGNEEKIIVKFVSRTLLLLVLESENNNQVFKTLRKLVRTLLKVKLNKAKEDFFESLEQLMKMKISRVWYIIAVYLLEFQQQNDCKILNSDFVAFNLCRVLRYIIGLKDVNYIELFVMLVSQKCAEEMLEKIRMKIKSEQQMANFLILLEMFKDHQHEEEEVLKIRNKRIKYYYYMEVCKQDPSFKGKFDADIDSIDELFKTCHSTQFTPQLLQRMSRDFVFDYQQLLMAQIVRILNSQEPAYEIKTDAFGEEELVMLNSTEEMIKQCQPYLNEITCTELLINKLKSFMTKINFYFYELYLCIIELLSYLDATPKELQFWRSILQFLKHKMVKRRRNRPGQWEIDAWLSTHKEINIPNLARFRLPFKPLIESQLHKILENESSVENCESWFPLIQMHCGLLDIKDFTNVRDNFCMSVVKNFLADCRTERDREVWHLRPINNAVLKSVLRVVKNVKNHSKVFAILYFMSNYAPDGADLVEASYECYKYVLENEALITDEKYIEFVPKIKRRYPSLKTQHLLHFYGLNDEKLLRLVEDPKELIIGLYHHDVVLKSNKLDINSVAREIAELHDLNIEIIQYELLQKWLAFSLDTTVDGTMLEETFYEENNGAIATNGISNHGEPAEYVLRAFHILKSWPKMETLQFLVAHTHSSEGSINASKQLLMYECFSKLNDGSREFSNILEQRKFVTIKCVHELKQLGFNCSVEKFMTCNKKSILKEMWERNPNQTGLEVMANICLGFDIYISNVWNYILYRMSKCNMVKQLNALVDILSTKPQLLYVDGLISAWECVLIHPFKTANQSRSFAQEEILHKALFRLQSCPVVHQLNLVSFTEQCVRLDRPHLAAVPLAFCLNEKDVKTIIQLIRSRSNPKLRQEICELEDAEIFPAVLNLAIKKLQL